MVDWTSVINQVREEVSEVANNVNEFTTGLSNGRFDLGSGLAGGAQDLLENRRAQLDEKIGAPNGCTQNCKSDFEDATGQYHMSPEREAAYERMKAEINDSGVRASSEAAQQAMTEKLSPKELGKGLHNVNQALFKQQAMGGELQLSVAEMAVAQQAKEMIEANGGDISEMVKEAGVYGDNIKSFSNRMDQIPDAGVDKVDISGPSVGLGG